MFKRKFSYSIALCIVCILIASCDGSRERRVHDPIPSPKSAQQRIIESLTARFPQLHVTEVTPRATGPLYEIITQEGIYYADAGGDILIAGNAIDLRTGEDETAKEWGRRHPIQFNDLPLNLAIKNVFGDGSRKFAVFADPECQFCRKLEREIMVLKNVTVYTFLYPIVTAHPDAEEISRHIWCAPDRAAAWTNWLRQAEVSESLNCDDPGLGEVKALATQIGVLGTPTMLFASGHRRTGVLRATELEQELEFKN